MVPQRTKEVLQGNVSADGSLKKSSLRNQLVQETPALFKGSLKSKKQEHEHVRLCSDVSQPTGSRTFIRGRD